VLGESAPSAQRCSLRAQPRIFLSELRDLRTHVVTVSALPDTAVPEAAKQLFGVCSKMTVQGPPCKVCSCPWRGICGELQCMLIQTQLVVWQTYMMLCCSSRCNS
jgi:hypothetical protein